MSGTYLNTPNHVTYEITIYGIFMTPISWSLALIVWGYALVSFLINDQIKVWLFRKIHPYS